MTNEIISLEVQINMFLVLSSYLEGGGVLLALMPTTIA